MIKWYFIIASVLCLILLVQQIWKRQFKTIWLVPIAMCFWPILIVIGILNKLKGEQKIANAFNSEGLRFAQIYVKEKRSRERKRVGKPIEHVLVRTHVVDFDKFEEGLKKLLLPKDGK